MSKKKQKRKTKSNEVRPTGWLVSQDAYDTLCIQGYTPLSQNPEVITACRTIADLISSMTIHLMANTEKGDIRIVDGLSRALDIAPNRYMTRKTFIDAIAMNLLLYGRGNSVVRPHFEGGYLTDLEPIPASSVSFLPDGYGYKVLIGGVQYNPDEVLHFVYNPDPDCPWRGIGLNTALRDVAQNLRQAAATERGFMADKWKPSVIVKVDAMTEEFASPKGRRKLLDEYISTSEVGEPWLIPADQFQVEQVRPLSLADLAIADVVQLDKRTVASIIGVPPFVLGVGDYSEKAWNGFINNKVRPIAREIEQELTRKLLLSPKMYWRFNISSLYSYDLKTTADVYGNLYVRGLVAGNEVRDKIGMTPRDGLDDLVILENFIKVDRLDDQKKLLQGGGDSDE